MIEISNLTKKFGNVDVLKNVNLKIEKNEKIAILGPSGSGKSTLLRCINLLETPTTGQIFFEGNEITNNKTNIKSVRQQINMVFQNFNLFANLSAINNVAFAPIKLKHLNKQTALKESEEFLNLVGLGNKINSFPHQLSGGQQQRVAIARALAMQPKVLLLDEPTSALDPKMKAEVINVLEKISDRDLTIVCITHELNFAKKFATRAIYFDSGEIVEDSNIEQFFNAPKADALKQFLQYNK